MCRVETQSRWRRIIKRRGGRVTDTLSLDWRGGRSQTSVKEGIEGRVTSKRKRNKDA